MSVDSASRTLVRNSFFLAPGQPKKGAHTSFHKSQTSRSTMGFSCDGEKSCFNVWELVRWGLTSKGLIASLARGTLTLIVTVSLGT